MKSVFAAALVLGLGSLARADVKIVSLSTVKGIPEQAAQALPGSDKPSTVTTYYKGKKQRVEDSAAPTFTITDFETGKVTTVNPKAKTYYTVLLADLGKELEGIPLTTSLVKADVRSTNEKKIIGGKEARLYRYSAQLKMGLEGADSAISAMLPTITLEGEQWTTDQVALAVDFKEVAQTTVLRRIPALNKGGVGAFADKLAAIKGFPLSRLQTIKFVLSASAKESPFAQMVPKEPIETRDEIISLSEDTLPETLFLPPADYKPIAAPTATAPGSPGF